MAEIVPFEPAPDSVTLPAAFTLPAFDKRLDGLVAAVTWPHPDQPAPMHYPAGAVAAAARELGTLEALTQPADDEVVRQWLMWLAGGVANPPTREDLAGRITAIRMCGPMIPAGAWTIATLRECLMSQKYFPSVAEIAALVTRDLRPLHDRIFALRHIVRVGPGRR